MLSISVKDFLFWKKKQLSKGGDNQSLEFLLDCIGGISTCTFNMSSLNLEGSLYLKKNLDYLSNIWDCLLYTSPSPRDS